MFLNPPSGMHDEHADLPPDFPQEHPEQDVQCPLHDEGTATGFFPAVSRVSSLGKDVATLRIMPERSRKSIFLSTSAVVVCNSDASISTVRERPSFNRFNRFSILPNQETDVIGGTGKKQ